MSRIKPALRQVLFLLRGGEGLNGCDDEHSARGFHLLLTIFLGWVVFMGFVVVPLFAVRKTAGAAVFLVLGIIGYSSIVLLRRGWKRTAAALFLSVFWCILAGYSVLSGGIFNQGPYLAFVVILDAAWLLGLPAALGFAAATLLVSLVEALLVIGGHAPPVYFPTQPLARWAVEVVIVGLTIGPV